MIERTGLPRTKAEAAVDTVFEGLKQALAAGERIELRGFGVFSVRARKTGIGRNPRTGTEVNIAPGKAVRFKPGKELHSLEPAAPRAEASSRVAGSPASVSGRRASDCRRSADGPPRVLCDGRVCPHSRDSRSDPTCVH